jgi:hypothetical protein
MITLLRLLFSDTINITDNSFIAQLHEINDFTVCCFCLAIFQCDTVVHTELEYVAVQIGCSLLIPIGPLIEFNKMSVSNTIFSDAPRVRKYRDRIEINKTVLD